MKSLHLLALIAMTTPTFGAIVLTNGDFTNGGASWSTISSSVFAGTSSPYSFTTGATGNASTSGAQSSLYQQASDVALQSAVISFDYTFTASSTTRNLDFSLQLGNVSGSATGRIRVVVNGSNQIQFLNSAGTTFFDPTTPSPTLSVGNTYRFTLALDGLDGAGGVTGSVSVDIFNLTTSTSITGSTPLAGTDSGWASFDSIGFRHGGNWTGNVHSVDNITVVPEPSVALLGGCGLLGLLRRRRQVA